MERWGRDEEESGEERPPGKTNQLLGTRYDTAQMLTLILFWASSCIFYSTFKTYFPLRIASLKKKKKLHCVVDSLEKEGKLVENANEVMIVRYASL